uniref:Methyltransferase type 11 domain-containing protein n=1 Tax=Rhodosorus marinus TaxID=101924 RepID=A0A7S2Z9C7_9RHOD|mmetsp:Transcript_10936/g.45487  ORF Transcript_10936/g.45487 Transcript_10936/m.45487 type:complete len:258 (+) Transcript_10936:2536-3309(+)
MVFLKAGLYFLPYAAGVGSFFLWRKSREGENAPPVELRTSLKDKKFLYQDLAGKYDASISADERLMLLGLMRYWLVSKAEGHVLEVAGGTGRNFKYYKPECNVTFTDSSVAMVQTAQAKANKLRPKEKAEIFKFEVQDAENLKYPDNSFDTVVGTFGLCSVDHPEKQLKEMQRVCKADGTILLLEHGASSFEVLRNLQAVYAQKHYDKWGCIYNRDIDKLVEESGSSVQDKRTYHLGTTHLIIAKPNKENPPQQQQA